MPIESDELMINMKIYGSFKDKAKYFNLIQFRSCLFLFLFVLVACDDESASQVDGGETVPIAGEAPTVAGMTSLDMNVSSGSEIEMMGGEAAGMLMVDAGMTTGGSTTAGMNMDGGTLVESGGEDASQAGMMNNEMICETSRSKDDQLLALSFPFSETIGEPGETIQIYRLDHQGLQAWGERLTLGFKATALEFTKDGLWLLAVGERGQVKSIDLRSETPMIVDDVALPVGGYRSIQQNQSSRSFDVINSNSDELAGLYQLQVNCEGDIDAMILQYPLRLIQGFSRFKTAPDQAIIFGGQALFDPIDLIDLRLLRFDGEAWTEQTSLDLYEDFIDAINVGLSPSGDWITAVNGSPFTEEGGQVRFVEVKMNPMELTEVQLFEGFSDVRGAWFMPDGQAVAITQLQANAVQFFAKAQDQWEVAQRIEGIGLAEMMVILPLPTSQEQGGWMLYIPSTSPSGGSGVSILRVLDANRVMSLPTFNLGNGFSNIPGVIAGWPKVESL